VQLLAKETEDLASKHSTHLRMTTIIHKLGDIAAASHETAYTHGLRVQIVRDKKVFFASAHFSRKKN